jgi:hypothetical protein
MSAIPRRRSVLVMVVGFVVFDMTSLFIMAG